MMSIAQPKPFRKLLEGDTNRPIWLIWELLKILFCVLTRCFTGSSSWGSDHTFPALMLGLIEIPAELTPGLTRSYKRQGLELKEKFEKLLDASGDDDCSGVVVLHPAHPLTAPKHSQLLLFFFFNSKITSPLATCFYSI